MSIMQMIDLSRDTIQPLRESVNTFYSIPRMARRADTMAVAQDSQPIERTYVCSAIRFSGRAHDTVKNFDTLVRALHDTSGAARLEPPRRCVRYASALAQGLVT